VTEGEALFHVATFVTSDEAVAERIDKVEEVLDRALSGSGYEEPPIV
jgi:hypothetical protein